MTTVHISIFTSIGAFLTSAFSLLLGYLLIDKGSTGTVFLEVVVSEGMQKINFYCYVPGLFFALLGASIAAYALKTLIKKS
jgi:hypothetical protein